MFTKKIITLFAITLFAFICGVSDINAQALKIGSVVNLQNQYPGENGYLDTRGRVMDKSQFRTATTETTFVSTNLKPNRDNGSGNWKIVSTTGKADGSPLLYGDKIHLMNMYPGAGYLDSYGYIKDMPAFASYVSGGSKIGVFTTQSKNRDNGSGTWIVKSASSKADGTPVNQGDTIHLQNGYPNSGYLDINGSVTENPTFKEYAGSSSLVFVAESSNRFKNSGTWKITNAGSSNKTENKAETAETKVFRKSLIGTWSDGNETISFNNGKVVFSFIKDGKPYNTSPYSVVDEETVKFNSNDGAKQNAIMSIEDNNTTLIWHRPDQGKNYKFKRVK